MTNSVPRRPRVVRWKAALVLLGLAPFCMPAARSQGSKPARQVTVFAIVATPNAKTIDPKLASIAPQLRKLLPNHGFKLVDVRTKRLQAGQMVSCNLGSGRTASAALMSALDEDGKVQLHCELSLNSVPRFVTQVATPPNQLFFFDKSLDDGSRLLIGVGAR
jgi:hypothetical protein